MSKRCPGCNLDKEDFGKSACRSDGKQIYCKECKKKQDATYYQKNKAAQLARNRANRKKYQAWLNEYKASCGCKCCPENDPCCLDFHHISGKKEKAVSTLLWHNSRVKAIKEIEKCVVVCGNCHRKIHKGKIQITKD